MPLLRVIRFCGRSKGGEESQRSREGDEEIEERAKRKKWKREQKRRDRGKIRKGKDTKQRDREENAEVER